MMQNKNYVVFEISGVKHKRRSSLKFSEDAKYEFENDQFIKKIVISSDISSAIFYLHDSLHITDEIISEIFSYLYKLLGSMMISLLKNSSQYPNVLLMPVIRISSHSLTKKHTNSLCVHDRIPIVDNATVSSVLYSGNDILKKWVHNTDMWCYSNHENRYDILFLLLKEENRQQKYMAMYAYLMSLVREINSAQKEGQKQVIKYITDNCSKVQIDLRLSQSTRQGAKPDDKEDQFTLLRNKIAHPDIYHELVDASESDINGLASLICSAIEDVVKKKQD